MIDGVEVGSGGTAWPTTGAAYQRLVLASGLTTGAIRQVRIICITPLQYKTSGSWYDAYVELDGSGIASVAHAAATIEAYYGDSITGLSASHMTDITSPPITDARYADMYIASEATEGNAAINGVGGGAVVNTGRDGTAVIPSNATRVHVRYGTNDLTNLGTGGGQTTFQTAYGVMIDNIRDRIGPGKPIYCYEPFNRADNATFDGRRALALSLIQAAIAGKADVYAISTDAWIYTGTGYASYMPDGLHPNVAGYAMLANREIPVQAYRAITMTPTGVSGSTYTVSLATGATFTGDQTITLSDGGDGGTITPSVGSPGTSSVTVTPTSSSTSFTFTYTPASAGTKMIVPTSGQDRWIMPDGSTFNGTLSADRRTATGLILSSRR